MAAKMAFIVLAGLVLVSEAQTTVNAATTNADTTAEPTTLAPTTTDVTTTLAATTVAPTTLADTTTVDPTTVAPTTVAPTTVAPTTEAPTTVAPTTVAPTTVAPTTVAPTTVAPTTVAPTTVAATTVAATTVAPTTVAPTVAPTAAATTVAGATTEAPTTVAGATTVAPTTAAGATTAAPVTTTMAPTVAGATTMAPDTTTMAPGATTMAPGATTMAPGATTMAPGATTMAGVPIAGAATTTAQSQGLAVADSHPNLLGTLIYPMTAASADKVLKGRQTAIAAHFEEMKKVAEAVEKQAGLLASTVSTRFILKLKYQFSFSFMTEPNVETKVRAYDAAKSLSCSLALISAGKCSVSLVNEDLASLRSQVQQIAALRGGLRRLQAAQTAPPYPAYNLTMGYNLNITDPAEATGLILPADSTFDSDFLNTAESVLETQLPGQNVKDNLVAVSKPVVSAQTLVQVLAEEDKKDVEYHQLQAQALMPAPLTTAYASATNSSLGAVTPVVDMCLGRSCGGNGVCVHGTCLCNAGWSRPNCLAALSTATQAPASSSAAMTSLWEDHPWPWAVVIGLAAVTLLVCCAFCASFLVKPEARLLKKEAMVVDESVIEKTYI